MKTFILFAVVSLFLIGCKIQKIERESLYGSFYNDKKYLKDYKLILRPDSIFYWSGIGRESGFGKWRIKDNKFVILRYQDIDPLEEAIMGGPRGPKEFKFQIVDADHLKLKDIFFDFEVSEKIRSRLRYKNLVLKRKEGIDTLKFNCGSEYFEF